MSIKQHTPGPWYIAGEITDRFGDTTIIKDADREVVCEINEDDYDENNANLIAAAPELLEALDEFLSIDDWVDSDIAPLSLVDKARAAIAKARGEV
jgi:hypothetical protein